jgi:hypothetical protein
MYKLRNEKEEIMNGDKMNLLPVDAIKSIELSLDLNREVPRILSIG